MTDGDPESPSPRGRIPWRRHRKCGSPVLRSVYFVPLPSRKDPVGNGASLWPKGGRTVRLGTVRHGTSNAPWRQRRF